MATCMIPRDATKQDRVLMASATLDAMIREMERKSNVANLATPMFMDLPIMFDETIPPNEVWIVTPEGREKGRYRGLRRITNMVGSGVMGIDLSDLSDLSDERETKWA